jgi:predicted thioesterase
MTRQARRILGRRVSFYIVALGLLYLAGDAAMTRLVVPRYEQIAEQVRVKYEVGEALGYLPAWAKKP